MPNIQPGKYRNVAAGQPLSPRQLAVLEMVALGKTNDQIGQALYLSPETIKHHVQVILIRLDAINRTHVVHVAHMRGMLSSVTTFR